MANTAENIFAYGDSVVSILPEGITRDEWPTTWDEALPAGTLVVGFTSTDGETLTKTVETTDIDANQQAKVRQLASNGSATLDFTALEDNPVTRWLYNAVQPTEGTDYTDVTNFANSVTRVICYDTSDTQDGFEKHKRFVGLANILPNGGVTFVRGSAAQRPFQASFLGGYREISQTDIETAS